jgi:sugar lactone lactonase YvrE
MRRIHLLVALASLALLLPLAASSASRFPDRIDLPDGFQPEGIAIGRGTNVYVGSIPTGRIWRGDLRTGQGAVLVPDRGRRAIGVDFHRGRLFVAGGPTGSGFVYDARTGADIAQFNFATAPTFVNDVVATRHAVWFTDSFNPVLYKIPLGRRGAPGRQADVQTVPLAGVRYREGFNVNGIEATPDGETLLIVQSNTGFLFTVDAATGRARRIELDDGARVRNGDGLLLDGSTLYVVQNFDNRIAVVELERGLRSGTVVRHLRDEDFDIPTTVAHKAGFLYVVNARFTTPVTEDTDYWVTVIPKP